MKLIISAVYLYIMLKCGESQFDFNDFYRQQLPNIGYQTLPANNYFSDTNMFPFMTNSDYNYELDECGCDCNRCDNPRACCIEFCMKCTQENKPSGYVFVPYPYIVIANMPNNVTHKATEANIKVETPSTTEPTTTSVIETTTVQTISAVTTENVTFTMEPEYLLRENFMNSLTDNPKSFMKPDSSKFMLTALRRTKPRWMPKFGIVPIPDQLADKLMLRIRHMKVLQPERDTIRKIDTLYP